MIDLTSLLRADDTRERCGLLLGEKIIEGDNTHPTPESGFRIDPAFLVKNAKKATATWHTHPNSSPELSEEDYAGFTQWPKLVHHIVGVVDGKASVNTYVVKNGAVIKL